MSNSNEFVFYVFQPNGDHFTSNNAEEVLTKSVDNTYAVYMHENGDAQWNIRNAKGLINPELFTPIPTNLVPKSIQTKFLLLRI